MPVLSPGLSIIYCVISKGVKLYLTDDHDAIMRGSFVSLLHVMHFSLLMPVVSPGPQFAIEWLQPSGQAQ